MKQEDILKASEDIIVHQVNTLGVMGAGLALKIKNKYPEVYKKYKAVASDKCIGKIQIIKAGDKYICNMFSQVGISRAKRTTDYFYLRVCLEKLNKYAQDNKLSIAIPFGVGCGLAGGDWSIVEDIIHKTIKVKYEIYRR